MTSHTDRVLARPPALRHRSVPLAVLYGVLLVAVAVVAVRDLAVSQGWAQGDPWLAAVVRSLDGLEADTATLVVGTAVGLVGLVLLVIGLSPAQRRYVRATEATQLWSTPAAIGEVSRTAADRAPGVLAARVTRAGRRRIVLQVTTRGDAARDDASLSGAREVATAPATALGARRIDVRLAEEDS